MVQRHRDDVDPFAADEQGVAEAAFLLEAGFAVERDRAFVAGERIEREAGEVEVVPAIIDRQAQCLTAMAPAPVRFVDLDADHRGPVDRIDPADLDEADNLRPLARSDREEAAAVIVVRVQPEALLTMPVERAIGFVEADLVDIVEPLEQARYVDRQDRPDRDLIPEDHV